MREVEDRRTLHTAGRIPSGSIRARSFSSTEEHGQTPSPSSAISANLIASCVKGQ